MLNTKRATAAVLGAALALSLTACSSHGGRPASLAAAAGGGGALGVANTPKMTIAMVTHQQPGDAFWDIIKKGAEAAAAKDNVDFSYSNSNKPDEQATFIQAAIDKKVDGIAVTDPNTGALSSVIKAAVAAGIPVVMFNAGQKDAFGLGAIGYFGQDETQAGNAAGARLAKDGAKDILCVEQDQGQAQLEARCDGAKDKANSAKFTKLYVNGADSADVTSKVQAALTQDPSIDYVLALGAQFSILMSKARDDAGSKAKIVTFDTNQDLVQAIKDGKVEWAIDQQPYLQGYLAVDSLWLYKTNGNTIGGGGPVATGPAFIDKTNVDSVLKGAQGGTR